MAIAHLPRVKANQAGFSMLELIIALVFILMISSAMAGLSRFVSFAMNQGEAKAVVINTARNGLDAMALEARNDLVLINTVPNTPLGVNFDLNDPASGNPAVRDGLLFYFDKNQTARLVDLNGDGQIDNLGADDANADNLPDLIGLALVPQEFMGNGAQDFVDSDFNKKPDDLNGDGKSDDADRLWRLVLVRFDNIAQVNDVSRWRQGRTIAANIFLRKLNTAGALAANNINTIQYSNNGEEFVPFDANNNGHLEETEIGNSETVNARIDSPAEVKRIGAITINLDLAVDFDYGRKVSFSSLSSIIKPRAFEVLRRNDITIQNDTIGAGNIN